MRCATASPKVSRIARGYESRPSVVTRSRACPATASAPRKNCRAATMSRPSPRRASTRLPSRSIARYREHHVPLTFMEVSSAYHDALA
ncbi:MAG: hypothetical protein AVDCRST_MAG88-2480 [uncultured Thermomicrobiales bacterium]|uniref:Uncharacterized protein n=1 Tax=uncultured Thermomicrobiales bacterium TaxID=1645740 RepID=A0A6J4VBH3_9BACT|nr:MAG: hypothetical protein AVDCRST_MAG88-2480 [uncultured Thermomicrobiales bacterium]